MLAATYRSNSKTLLVVFVVCLLFWVTRFSRNLDLHFPEFLELWAQQECSVWLEHFAAALGLPALAASAGFYIASRPTKSLHKNQPLADWLLIFFCGAMGMLGYCVSEFGFEAMQLTLAKKSNYGQFLADHCIPAENIAKFGACSKQYFTILSAQLIADAAGLFAFLALFMWLAYGAGKDHVSLVDSQPLVRPNRQGAEDC